MVRAALLLICKVTLGEMVHSSWLRCPHEEGVLGVSTHFDSKILAQGRPREHNPMEGGPGHSQASAPLRAGVGR